MIHIRLESELSIEPGHQWLIVSDSPEGRALVTLLMGRQPLVKRGTDLLIPHNGDVDERIVKMINELAHARYQSPTLLQLTLQVAPHANFTDEEDGGLEGA